MPQCPASIAANGPRPLERRVNVKASSKASAIGSGTSKGAAVASVQSRETPVPPKNRPMGSPVDDVGAKLRQALQSKTAQRSFLSALGGE